MTAGRKQKKPISKGELMDAGAEQTVHKIVKNSIFYLLALLIALGLKYHYSRAPSGGLVWILGPTAGVVEYMSGIGLKKKTDRDLSAAGTKSSLHRRAPA